MSGSHTLAKERYLSAALGYMHRMGQVTEPYRHIVQGTEITVLPQVFSPRYFTDTDFFASQVPQIVGRGSFLEVGLGTGVIALLVALNGAYWVTGTDINPAAIENTELNFKQHDMKISARLGSVFDPLKRDESFDFVFWNHPYQFDAEAENVLQRSGLDFQYAGLEDYFRLGKYHLDRGGELLLGTSNIARIRVIEGFARKYGYHRRIVAQKEATFAKGDKRKIDLRIYSFVPTREV
ncbi:MAG TPA: methyltransferase [Candidatus Paceibacterota bacterium]